MPASATTHDWSIRMNRRTRLTLLAAGAALALSAAPAQAAHVTRNDFGGFTGITATDNAAETNKIMVSSTGGGFFNLTDAGAAFLTAPGCDIQSGGVRVECFIGAGQTTRSFSVVLGKGDDYAVVNDMPGVAGVSANLSGGPGRDTLISLGPKATMFAGEGDDRLIPGPGADDISGDTGADTVDYSTRSAGVVVNLASDQATMGAAGEHDRIRTVENVLGGKGADQLGGDASENVLYGGPGADKLSGAGGNDSIEARDNVKDAISCGSGADEVQADFADVVSADCESVIRSGKAVGPGELGTTPPTPDPQPQPQPGPDPKPDPQPAPVDVTSPGLTKVAFAPRAFRVAASVAKVSAAKRRGSALGFTVTEPATVRVGIERTSLGRRSGGRCVRPTARLRARGARRCTRAHKVTTITRSGAVAGRNALTFTGRIGGHSLRRGTYRATVTARDGAGNTSKARRTLFRIVR